MKNLLTFLRILSISLAVPQLCPASEPSSLQVAEGPIALHANVDQQWGGHTFSYLLEGETGVFWSATTYNPDGKTWGSVIGQHPKSGAKLSPAATLIPFTEPNVKSMTQPLMLRSDDGYIHIFIGMSHDIGVENFHPGQIRYFRSAAPEDITTLVDRTELIPRDTPYKDYHLRMNAGVSRDGKRAAIVILAISPDGSVPFNTPVIFFADKRGPDFVFKQPVKYAEAMGFFYPQIALTEHGTVLVGQLWDNPDRSLARLVQLDGEGKVTHTEDLPAASDGNYWCLDLRPASAENWDELVLYYNKYPKDKADCRHEFWTYAPATHALTQRHSIPVPEGRINYGKWIPLAPGRSAFLHNPSMGTYNLIEGDLLNGGAHTVTPLPATSPTLRGYAGTAHTFVPNPLQGSINTPGTVWFASDYIPQRNDPQERIRATMLLYRLAFGG